MRAVWKFPLALADEVELDIPRGAEMLDFQMQGRTLCIWALVDPEAPKELRTFRVAGTGHPLPDEGLRYIGTTQQLGGALVWHLFECEEKSEEAVQPLTN